jgi:hypothetical protein
MRLALTFFFFFFILGLKSQNLSKYRTTEVNVFEKTSTGDWEKVDGPIQNNLLITLNLDDLKITVYSSKKQTFDIISNEVLDNEKDKNYFRMPFHCLDQDGKECDLEFIAYKQRDNQKQLIIIYNKISIVYNIYNID